MFNVFFPVCSTYARLDGSQEGAASQGFGVSGNVQRQKCVNEPLNKHQTISDNIICLVASVYGRIVASLKKTEPIHEKLYFWKVSEATWAIAWLLK